MSVDQIVTRFEIAEAVNPAFARGGATRDEIVATAASGSRREVVELLERLPDRRYHRLNELWEELRDIPVGA